MNKNNNHNNNKIIIAIGSNIDAQQHINQVLNMLRTRFHSLKKSKIYQSKPWPNPDVGADYLNLAVQVESDLQPLELLHLLQKIELDLNRERPYPNAPRTIDLDIILFHNIVMNTDELIVPHPRYHERSFVLLPMLDLNLDLNLGLKLNSEQRNMISEDIENGKIWEVTIQ